MFQLSQQSRTCIADKGNERYNVCPLTFSRCMLKSFNNDLVPRRVEIFVKYNERVYIVCR